MGRKRWRMRDRVLFFAIADRDISRPRGEPFGLRSRGGCTDGNGTYDEHEIQERATAVGIEEDGKRKGRDKKGRLYLHGRELCAG